MSENTKMSFELASKLGKLILGKTKTGTLVLCHEENMNLGFGLMMNHRIHFASSQSRLLRITNWKQCQKSDFCKWNGPGKVCKQIRQELKLET